jgi:hypothetical protein
LASMSAEPFGVSAIVDNSVDCNGTLHSSVSTVLPAQFVPDCQACLF